jgi:hypothetical protein
VISAGWLKIPAVEYPDAVARLDLIVQSLGTPVAGRKGRVVEELAPISQENAQPKSLSAIHGVSPFPLHTDGEHLIEPPRFIVLACIDPGSCPAPTVLVRFDDLKIEDPEREILPAATYLVRNGRRSFYSSVYDTARPFVRFDQACMEPIDDNARRTTEMIVHRGMGSNLTIIHWRKGDLLIIDNWRVLHGRGHAGLRTSRDRRLLRASVQ